MTTKQPPFPIPNNLKNRAHYLWAERTIPEYSDGEEIKWPTPNSGYKPSAQEFYLCHLGQRWAENDGIDEEGVNYYINKLPSGYGLFEIKQPGGPQTYRRLFGHPSGRFYDSTARFEAHFLWLMSGMLDDCECVLCTRNTKAFVPRPRKPRNALDSSVIMRQRRPKPDDEDEGLSEQSGNGLAIGRTQRRVKQAGKFYAQDEEGNEDIYKDCVHKLQLAQESSKGIEVDLTEESSIDWKAERECLPQYLTQIEQQHSFVPRTGELVLWCPSWPVGQHLVLDKSDSRYKFYSFDKKRFYSTPEWRGGIVAAVPSDIAKNGIVDFGDILDLTEKKTSMNCAGFRIETTPDPNADLDKSSSKQYRFVPLRNIRPLSQWQMVLRGINRDTIHESVFNSLVCMTSISLLDKYRFLGDWPSGGMPNGRIFCKGIYIGSEMIIVGDTIRLLSQDYGGSAGCSDVMVVTSIRYNLIDIRPEDAQPNSATLSSASSISFVGQAYTTDATRAFETPFDDSMPADGIQRVPPISHETVKTVFRSVGANEYGPWYALHGPNRKLEVSHEQVLGRLYEADAVRLWEGLRQDGNDTKIAKPQLGTDVESILAARRYASATDERLQETDDDNQINWFLADTRAEALAIASLNGVDVNAYYTIRDSATLKQWRHQVRIADGRENAHDPVKDVPMIAWKDVVTGQRGRPAGSKVINGKLVLPSQLHQLEQSGKPREEHKSSSQMAGAALASDSEDTDYDSEVPKFEDIDDKTKTAPNERGVSIYPTKQEIMESVEHGDIAIIPDDDVSEEDEWLESVPLARGGTEESEGGDYKDD